MAFCSQSGHSLTSQVGLPSESFHDSLEVPKVIVDDLPGHIFKHVWVDPLLRSQFDVSLLEVGPELLLKSSPFMLELLGTSW